MNDVLISYSELSMLIRRLSTTVEELRSSRDRSNDLDVAIAMPFMRSELTSAARESESRWSIKRGNLADELESILQKAEEIYDGFKQFEDEAAAAFEGSQTEAVPSGAQ